MRLSVPGTKWVLGRDGPEDKWNKTHTAVDTKVQRQRWQVEHEVDQGEKGGIRKSKEEFQGETVSKY